MKKPILFAVVILVVLLVINLSAMRVFGYIQEDGYVVTSEELKKVMDMPEQTGTLTTVQTMDEILTRFDGYFINSGKNKLNTDYPLLLEGGQSVRFFNEKASLISNEFYVLPTYDGLYLSNGHSYNTDKSLADADEFIFARLNNGVYLFAQEGIVESVYEKIEIQTNSLAILNEDSISFMEMQEGKFSTNQITALNGATIQIGENRYDYYQLYSILNGLQYNEKEVEPEIENPILQPTLQPTIQPTIEPIPSISVTEEPIVEPSATPHATEVPNVSASPSTPIASPSPDASSNPTEPGGLPGNHPETFKAPVVKLIKELDPWVYDVTSALSIEDESHALYRGVQVYVYYAGSDRLFMRKTVREEGDFTLGTLMPDTEYDLSVAYKYRTLSREKIDVVVTEQPIRFKTLGRQELVPVQFSMEENGLDHTSMLYYPYQIKLYKMHYPNLDQQKRSVDVTDRAEIRTMQYITKATITFTDQVTKETTTMSLPNSTIKKLVQGEQLDWISQNTLNSNRIYDYQIKFYDTFNVEIPMTDQSILNGISRTSKAMPVTRFSLTSAAVGRVQINLDITNKDSALIENLHFFVRDLATNEVITISGFVNGENVIGLDHEIMEGINQLVINNLPVARNFELIVMAETIDLEDNQEYKDIQLLKQGFYTESMQTLGTAMYDVNYTKITSSSANINYRISGKMNASLANFISKISLSLKDVNGNKVFNYVFKKGDLNHYIADDEAEMAKIKFRDGLYYYEIYEDDQVLIELLSGYEDNLYVPWDTIILSGYLQEKASVQVTFKQNALKSKTEYILNMDTYAEQGNETLNVTSSIAYPTLKTLRKTPKVTIENQFTATNFHEIYNYRIDDPDAAVGGKENIVVMRLYDGQTLISTKSLNVNTTYDIHRFANLTKNKQYSIDFLAVEYNVGFEAKTVETYKNIGHYTFTTGESVSASINIENTELNFADTMEGVEHSNLAKIAIEKGEIYRNKFFDSAGFRDFDGSSVIKVEVEPAQAYRLFNFNRPTTLTNNCYFYDENGNRVVANISYGIYTGISNISSFEVVAPENAKYMYVNFDSYFESTLTILKHNPELCQNSKNLFTQTDQKESVYISAQGALSTSPSWITTTFMEVQGSDYYDIEGNGRGLVIAFYDKNKEFISLTNILSNHKATHSAPANAKYARISYGVSTGSGTGEVVFKLCRPINRNRMNANVRIVLNDKNNNLILNPQYILRLYRTEMIDEGVEDKYKRYEDDLIYSIEVEEGKVKSIDEIISIANLPTDYAYKAEMFIRVYGNDISMGSTYFNTGRKLSSIYTVSDFAKVVVDPSANYYVYNDLETDTQLLSNYARLSGTIDFNGHTLTSANKNGLIYAVGKQGIIKNAVLNLNCYLEAPISYTGLVYYNYGRIEDVILNLNLSQRDRNAYYNNAATLVSYNYGVVDGFMINNQQRIYAGNYFALVNYANFGEIRNGWLIGKEVERADYGEFDETTQTYPDRNLIYTGIVNSENNGVIENIFNQIGAVIGVNKVMSFPFLSSTQNGYLRDSANFSNHYSYDPLKPEDSKESLINNTYNILVTNSRSRDTSNIVSFSQHTLDTIANQGYASKGMLQWLWDYAWYNTNINKKQGFNVYDLVTSGYYPQVKMSEIMAGKQPFINLPEYTMIEQDLVFSYVENQTFTDAIVVLTLNNPQNYITDVVEIDGLKTEVLNQYWDGNNYRVRVRVSNPTKYFSKYSVSYIESVSSSGGRIRTLYNASTRFGPKFVTPEFYDRIYSITDWSRVIADPSQNYRLMNDIDFAQVTDYSRIYVKNVFSGKMDGGLYDENEKLVGLVQLKNIKMTGQNNSIFSQVTGTIQNLVVDNLSMQSSNLRNYVGIVANANNAKILNLHLRNSTLSGSYRIGGIAAAAYTQSSFRECSVSDSTITYIETPGYTNNVGIGGLIGVTYGGVSVERSYVDHVAVKAQDATYIDGIGGLVGSISSTGIENCYSIAEVHGTGTYTGGVIGNIGYNTTVRNCWSDSNIITQGNDASQMGSFSSTGSNVMENNIVFGSSMSRFANATGIARVYVAGSTVNNLRNNYAYENQLLNGVISDELMDASFLANTSDLKDVNYWKNQVMLGEAFDYLGGKKDVTQTVESASILNNYLPMLLSESGDLVYGQRPHQFMVKLDYVVNGAVYDSNTNEFTINLTLNHSNYEVLEGFSMSGAKDVNYEKSTSSTNLGETTFLIHGKIQNAWDSYVLTLPLKNVTTGGYSNTSIQIAFDDGPIYHIIANLEMWNDYLKTRKNTYENIRIVGDIDFNGYDAKKDILQVKLNRFEGQIKNDGSKYKISNIDFATTTYKANIFDKVTSIKNLEFENINYDASKYYDGSNTGIFGEVLGEIEGVNFKKITMKYYSGSSIGTIAIFSGNSIQNVILEEINISSMGNAVEHVGGLVGYIRKSGEIKNVSMLGEKKGDTYTNNLIFPIKPNITVVQQIGGLFGSAAEVVMCNNLSVSGLNISGNMYINGIASFSNIQQLDQVVVQDSKIEALDSYSSGLVRSAIVRNSSVKNVYIIANEHAFGMSNYNVFDSTISDSTILAQSQNASGIGSYTNCTGNTILRTKIIAENKNGLEYAYVGGIRGKLETTYLFTNNYVIDSEIIGNGSGVGGVIGYNSSNANANVAYNTILNSTIKGTDKVGGLVGENANYRIYFGNYIQNTAIEGKNYVGGLIGYANIGKFYENQIGDQVIVKASENAAGGLFGYHRYLNASINPINYSQSYNNIVSAKVSAKDYAGGLMGIYEVGASTDNWPKYNGADVGIPTQSFANTHYYSHVFTGNVTCAGSHASLWVNMTDNSDPKEFYYVGIYENSTLNGKKATENTTLTAYRPSGPNEATQFTLTTSDMLDKEFYLTRFMKFLPANIDTDSLYGNTKQGIRVNKTNQGIELNDIVADGKQTIRVYANQITSASYVTDGLVVWYDGLNNSGLGSHDSLATQWQNLAATRNGSSDLNLTYDAKLYAKGQPISTTNPLTNTIYFDENSLVFNPPSQNNNYFALAENINLLLPANTTEYAFEFCFEFDDSYRDKDRYGALATINSTNTGKSLNFAIGNRGRLFYVGKDTWMSSSVGLDTDDFTLSFTSNSSRNNSFYRQIFSNGNYVYKGTNNAEMTADVLKLGASSWTDVAKRQFHSVRVYNRGLTEDEIAYNAKIDELFYKKYKGAQPSQISIEVEVKDGQLVIPSSELSKLADIKILTLEIGSQSVTVDYQDLKQTSLNLVDKDGNTVDSTSDIQSTPTIKANNASGQVSWYRMANAYGTDDKLVDTVASDQSVTLAGRGYYYCEDETGHRSSILFVNTPSYFPAIKSNGVFIEGYEGIDDQGNFYSSSDLWYSGGNILPGSQNRSTKGQKLRSVSIQENNKAVQDEMLKSFDEFGYRVYASDVDTLNIEFVDLNQFESTDNLTIYQNASPVFTTTIEKQVYSFRYDFKSDLSIQFSKQGKQVEVPLNLAGLISDVMVYKEHYYYLFPQGIGTDEGIIEGQFLHLMNGKALSVDGTILDCATQTQIGKVVVTEVLQAEKPLYQTTFGNQLIASYASFTKIIDQQGQLEKKGLIVSKKEMLIGIPSDQSVQFDSFIKDTLQDKDIYALVTAKGKLVDMTKELMIPKGVDLTGIKKISHNLYSDIPVVLIRYQTGKIVGFNYQTGELFDLIQPAEIEVGFLEYLGQSLGKIMQNIPLFASSYQDTLALNLVVDNDPEAVYEMQKLGNDHAEPIVKASIENQFIQPLNSMFETKTEGQLAAMQQQANKQGTVQVYNEKTQKFESYDVSDFLQQEEPLSKEEKVVVLQNQGKLMNIQRSGLFSSDSLALTPMNTLIGIGLLVIILLGVLLALKLRRK